MAWIAPVVGGGLALAGGLMSSGTAKSEGAKSRRLQKEQLDFAKSQYQDYKDMYGDIEKDMLSEIESFTPRENLQKYLGEATADVATAFENRQKEEAMRQGRYGIDPTQARSKAEMDKIGREKALAEVQAKTAARREASAETLADEDKKFARKLAAVSTGKQIPGQAGAVMGALQSGANMAGQASQRAGQAASGAYGVTGQWLAKGIDAYNQPPDQQPSISTGAMPGPNRPYGPGGYGTYTPQGAGYGESELDYG